MSKKHKRHAHSNPGASPRPAGKSGSRTEVFRAEEAEPVAERRPLPIWLITLLLLLLFWGDMYLMGHGADVAGSTGAFPKAVFDPYKTYEDLVIANPVSPEQVARNDGKIVFNTACVACHQGTGQGVAGQFPPLAGSEWVNTEGPNRIIHGVLCGLGGPLSVNGVQFNNSMPPWKETFTDEQIAHVLTYVRSEWGNKAPLVTPAEVKKVRDKVAARSEAFSETELKALPEKVE